MLFLMRAFLAFVLASIATAIAIALDASEVAQGSLFGAIFVLALLEFNDD